MKLLPDKSQELKCFNFLLQRTEPTETDMLLSASVSSDRSWNGSVWFSLVDIVMHKKMLNSFGIIQVSVKLKV